VLERATRRESLGESPLERSPHQREREKDQRSNEPPKKQTFGGELRTSPSPRRPTDSRQHSAVQCSATTKHAGVVGLQTRRRCRFEVDRKAAPEPRLGMPKVELCQTLDEAIRVSQTEKMD